MFGRQRRDALPEGDYQESLAVFQIEHGLDSADLTPEQGRRLRATEAAHGDVRAAKGLILARLRYRSGSLSDAL